MLRYHPHGDLFNAVSVGPVHERFSRRILHRIATAVATCHAHGVCHRDIKPENILINDAFQPVLCDFGLSSWEGRRAGDGPGTGPAGVGAYRPHWRNSSVGSEGYFAPEVTLGLPYDGRKADVVRTL